MSDLPVDGEALDEPDWMRVQTKYRRARRGDTVHLAGCLRAARTIPWLWAEGKSDAEMAFAFMEAPWLHPCKVCLPPAPKSAFADSLELG